MNFGSSFSLNVNKTRKQLSRKINGARMFLQCFPVQHSGNIVSSVSFCFQDANYAYATRQGILTKIRACEQLQKFCEHEQASTHLMFASNSSTGQILRALSNWMGPFDTPQRKGFIECIHSRVQQPCKIYWTKRKCLHTSSSQWEVSAAVKGVFECKYDNENFKMTCLNVCSLTITLTTNYWCG